MQGNVKAVLFIERAPTDERWTNVCSAQDVFIVAGPGPSERNSEVVVVNKPAAVGTCRRLIYGVG
jgi:hypothetical protein